MPRSPEDLAAHLRDQLVFLRTSGAAFDAGEIREAKRIAVAVRVLVHDTRNSTSLLSHLGIKDEVRFVDSAADMPFPEIRPMDETDSIFIGSPLAMIIFPANATEPIRCQARGMIREDTPKVPFGEWWTREVVSTGPLPENRYTRKELILAVANQDGGAHIDADVEEAYRTLAHGGGYFHIQSPGPPPSSVAVDPVPFVLRQIADEVLASIDAA